MACGGKMRAVFVFGLTADVAMDLVSTSRYAMTIAIEKYVDVFQGGESKCRRGTRAVFGYHLGLC